MYNSAVARASSDILKQVPLFAGLDQRELEQIAGTMRERRFGAGDTVTEEGAGGAGFFLVKPYAITDLLGAVDGSLGGRQSCFASRRPVST